MDGFKDFYYNYESNKAKEKRPVTEEQLFLEATNIEIPSLKDFTAWLVLNDHVNPTVRLRENRRPVSIFSLKANQRILHLVQKLPHIDRLAKEFVSKWR